jgi:hypothetical protein
MARGAAPARYDPLAPIAPRALRRQVTADVRAQTIPLARELTRQINAQAAAGAANIAGVSNQLAQTLGSQQGIQRDIYERARASQGALDTEQANAFGQAGQGLASGLAARLQSAGAPSTLADSLGAAMRGAAGAGLARGSAEVGQLTADQAGAESYAAKLPGLAQLAGLQGVSQRRAQAQQDLSTQLGALNAKVPGLIAQELESARQNEYNKAVARLGFGEKGAAIQGQNARTQAEINARLTVAQIQSRDRNRAIDAANQRTGQTLAERSKEHGITAAEQAKRDQQSYNVRRKALKERTRHDKATEKTQAKKAKGTNVTGLGK